MFYFIWETYLSIQITNSSTTSTALINATTSATLIDARSMCASSIAKPLAILFRNCLESECFPKE